MSIEVVNPPIAEVQVGAALLMMRKYLKYNQTDLAEVSEMTVSSYCRVESGQRSLKAAEAFVICEFYGITADDLVELSRLYEAQCITPEQHQTARVRFIEILDRYENRGDKSENN